MKAPEGVAAPLEPSPQNWIREAAEAIHAGQCLCDECDELEVIECQCENCNTEIELIAEVIRDHMPAYAVAVSKNLQQSVEQLCGDLQAIQQDYTNEKKRAENLQEELSLMEKKFDSLMADSNAIIKQPRRTVSDGEKVRQSHG